MKRRDARRQRSAALLASLVALVATLVAVGLPAHAETPLERGTYLVQSIVACGNCHTPKTDKGEELPGMELAGGLPIVEPHLAVLSPNITQDKDTGIGGWTDDQIVDAIRNGRRPDGSLIGPPMPVQDIYQYLSDTDVRAIVTYLRTVKPVRNAVPRNEFPFQLPPDYGPVVTHVPDVPRDDPVRYGGYLAGPLGHCIYCHTPLDERTMTLKYESHLGAGGLGFVFPFGTVLSANITSDPATGLGKWTNAEIKRAIVEGVSHDGQALLPPMPFGYFAKVSAADLDAIVAYLRTLPAKPEVRSARLIPPP